MNTVLLVVSLYSLLCSCSATEDNLKAFENLGDLNEKWFQAISVPELAMLLQYPPYSYFHKDLLNSIVPDLISSPNESRTSVKDPNERSCSDDILQILYNLESDWALHLLDSGGKLSSGVLRGSVTWPGHFGECNSVYSPKDEEGHGGFHGKYCITSWTVNLTKFSNLPLTIGLCFPDSCSEDQLKRFGGNILKLFNGAPELQKLSSVMKLTNVSCKLKEKSLDLPSIIYLVLISCFLFLSVIGSGVAVMQRKKKRAVSLANAELSRNQTSEFNSNVTTVDSEVSAINAIKKSYDTIPSKMSKSEDVGCDTVSLTQNTELGPESYSNVVKKTVDPVWKRVLMCFSAIDNGEKILTTNASEGQLLSVHGVRFLSLTWVILGHTYISSISIIGNRLDVLKQMDSFLFQVLLQSPLSVDSFFLLSGFLLTYLFLKDADRNNGKINWLYFYLHRIWRLTPVYMVVVFFYIYIFKYLGSGPFWEDNHCDEARDSWWKYLLYINNFIPIDKMCLGWSWYLANDMQFYLISPLFLYPLWRWPIIGISLLCSILIGTWTTTAILCKIYDILPLFVGVTHATNFAAYTKKMWNSFDLIYDKPYCRIAPYIFGVILGFILYKVNQRKNFMNWWHQVLGWSIAAFCSLSVIFGLYHVEMDSNTSMFYNTLCRSSFTVGLGWVIFVCETGHGGFVAKLLSWKAIIPLSRLTYCAYLIHPILIHGFYQAYQTELFFTNLVMVTNGLGFIFMSFGLAFLFSITFESPLMNLEKLLLKSKRH